MTINGWGWPWNIVFHLWSGFLLIWRTQSVSQNVVVQSSSCVRLFATPWTAACQASLFLTISWSLPKFMSIKSVMPSKHLIICHPLILLPSIFPSIRIFYKDIIVINATNVTSHGLLNFLSSVSQCVQRLHTSKLTSSVQFSRSVMSDSATPWIAARQASLFITNSRSSFRLTSIESVMPCRHLILCRPLLLLPPIPPSIRVFSHESTLRMRWPKYWSFSFSIIIC